MILEVTHLITSEKFSEDSFLLLLFCFKESSYMWSNARVFLPTGRKYIYTSIDISVSIYVCADLLSYTFFSRPLDFSDCFLSIAIVTASPDSA